MTPVWLEVALNGAAGPALQPGIPIHPSEIIQQAVDCVDAGAAIVHIHAYDDRGSPVEDADLYSQLIEGIKAQRDCIVYPTLALHGTLEQRLAPIQTLSERGLLEWSVVDPGSVNLTHRSQLEVGADGITYLNPDSHIRAALALAEEYQWRPAYAIYEPGFARLGAALAKLYPKLQKPVYRVMFSDNLLFGTPPTQRAIKFYAQHLFQVAGDAPWMISGLDADISSMIEPALQRGAHIRVGLEDAPLGTYLTNLEMVTSAADKIRAAGFELATAAQVRNAQAFRPAKSSSSESRQ